MTSIGKSVSANYNDEDDFSKIDPLTFSFKGDFIR